MIIVPPETEMEWAVYKDLKTDEYWKQMITKTKNDGSEVIEVKPKYSEGEKAIIYDTFKEIDKRFRPNYNGIDLHYYLMTIDEECNHTNGPWILAIRRIVKGMFKIDVDFPQPEKI